MNNIRHEKFKKRFDIFLENFQIFNEEILSKSSFSQEIYDRVPVCILDVYSFTEEVIILPKGYEIAGFDSRATYITDESGGIVCGFGFALPNNYILGKSTPQSFPKKKIITEEELILEQACLKTEKEFGMISNDYLYRTICDVRHKNYESLTTDNNIRRLVKRIRPKDLYSIMTKTLQRHDINCERIDPLLVIGWYTDYIKAFDNKSNCYMNKEASYIKKKTFFY